VQAVIDLAGPVTSGALNPATYVSKTSAPTLILHGTSDSVVSTQESQKLVSALKVAGVTTTLDLQFAVGHDLGALLSPVAMQTIIAFLDQQLKTTAGGRGGRGGLSSFVATPANTYIDPIALDLGGTQYRLYPTPERGAGTFGSYRIYLPPDYQANTSRRYPVIYFLHGRSVDSKRPLVAGYVARADAAIRAGIMPPTIIVIPQGLTTGWYVDAQDGQHPMESLIVRNLIPHIDASNARRSSDRGALDGRIRCAAHRFQVPGSVFRGDGQFARARRERHRRRRRSGVLGARSPGDAGKSQHRQGPKAEDSHHRRRSGLAVRGREEARRGADGHDRAARVLAGGGLATQSRPVAAVRDVRHDGVL
jgi:BD-FAE/Putative esterase